MLVPGFERASSGMFEQLHTAFSGGLKEFKSELSAPIMEAMQQSVAKATAAHEKLVARMVNDATAKVAGVAPRKGGIAQVAQLAVGRRSAASAAAGEWQRPLRLRRPQRCGRRPPRPHRSPLPLAMAQPT